MQKYISVEFTKQKETPPVNSIVTENAHQSGTAHDRKEAIGMTRYCQRSVTTQTILLWEQPAPEAPHTRKHSSNCDHPTSAQSTSGTYRLPRKTRCTPEKQRYAQSTSAKPVETVHGRSATKTQN